MHIDATILDRFWKKVQKTESCWLWTGMKSEKGYGLLHVNGKVKRAHQVAYIGITGTKIPEGMQLDHLCRNPACVNPSHLEPVTSRENTIRGIAARVAAHGPRKRKEFCKYGHPMSGENLYVRPDGQNACKTCQKASKERNFDPEKHKQAIAKYRKSQKIKKLLRKLAALGYELPPHP